MGNTNENIQRLYQSGLKQFSMPDFETFEQDMKDEGKRKRFYTNMLNHYTLPDFDTFSKDIGAVAVEKEGKAAQTVADSAAEPPSTEAQGLRKDSAVESGERKVESGASQGLGAGSAEHKGSAPGGASSVEKGAGQAQAASAWDRLGKTGLMSFAENVKKAGLEPAPVFDLGEYSGSGELKKDMERRAMLDSALEASGAGAAAEQAWQSAMARHHKEADEAAEQWLGGSNPFGGIQSNAMAAANASMVSELRNFDLDRLMDDAWANLGEEGQQRLVDGCFEALKAKEPNGDDIALYKEAIEMARRESNKRLFDLAVEKNLPKSSLEYLGRKIADANLVTSLAKGMAVRQAGTTGDMAAYEQANERYRQDGHKVIDIVGTVAGMTADPTLLIAGGVGGAATKAALGAWGSRLAGKGASAAAKAAATRQISTTLGGRLLGGVAGGAANFGTFEGIGEAASQFAHGGKVEGAYEDGRYVIGDYSPLAVAGQAAHGLMMGAAVGWITPLSGNLSDKLVRGAEAGGKYIERIGGVGSGYGKAATRAGVYAGATVLEGTIFAVPEWLEGERDGFDVWTDNIAMMVGFKGRHIMKSAGGVLKDLHASLKSPKDGAKNRYDFESRLRQRMDAPSDGGMALTKDERAELESYGYGDLRELVESAEATGDASQGSASQIASRLTDMVGDSRVSEAARAKMYYYATGRMLPVSTIMRGELAQDGQGGYVVESQGWNGVITSRRFKSRKAADLELERIGRQAELNQVELGERYRQEVDFDERLQDACRNVAGGDSRKALAAYKICRDAWNSHRRGKDKELGEAEQAIALKVLDAMGEFEEAGVTDALRSGIGEKHGADIDKALRKEKDRRSNEEQAAIDEYIAELYGHKSGRTVEDADYIDLNSKRIGSGAQPGSGGGDSDTIGGETADNGDGKQVPAPKYGPGVIWVRNEDGTERVGSITGIVVTKENFSDLGLKPDDIGKLEYYMAGEKRFYYAFEKELDDIVSKYVPKNKEEGISESEDNSLNLQGENANLDENGNRPEQDNGGSAGPQGADAGGRVASDAAGSVESNRDRSHIRVYEEGLGASHNAHTDDSERDRREAESERLVGIAKQQGQYREKAELSGLGSKVAKRSGESEVYINQGNGKVYKVKDPYAKGPMKGGVAPEDAIYEHLVHNKYFPETAYGFEGISEDGGDVRIVLSQDYVESVGQATKEQIEAALAEKGLKPEGAYRYGNEEVSVTDVTGDNALLGADGKVYFIDPIIDFKRPAREILGDGLVESGERNGDAPGGAPVVPETLPPLPEGGADFDISLGVDTKAESGAAGLGAGSAEHGGSAPAGASESALGRLPRDERGEPLFERAENAEHGWDALVEYCDGNVKDAMQLAISEAKDRKQKIDKANKFEPKGKGIKEKRESQRANAAALAQAQAEYDFWQRVAEVEKSRQEAAEREQAAERKRQAEAAKAAQVAAEDAARREREALEGMPEWHMDTPENARARGARRFGGQLYERQEPVTGVVGKEVEVKFSQNDLPKGRVAVIEAGLLQPSHMEGGRNPMYFIDEAQPKNRIDAASIIEAKRIADGIRPEEITGGVTAYTGAPTVNTRGEVIQGNNRSAALRFLWESSLPQQQAAYKQYLIDHAEEFGLDAEAVRAMKQPVLVNMLDVEDGEAIRLGQMTAQDTESGGLERIKPKNVAQKLGADMGKYANLLLRSNDEEATFGQLVDSNGAEVLTWLNRSGAISDTQYQSAFDTKGNLTAEAKNDLQKVLYQSIFRGGSQQLEEMFERLPAKAQRALLGTAFRDMDSPEAGRMLTELQSSVAAYDQLMSDPNFAGAKKMEEALRAIEAFKLQITLDDRFEQHNPSDNFSNFALHLAAMYKASDYSQSKLTALFNRMYDLAQGKVAATLFEEGDTTPHSLAEVVKEVLGIDYEPAKNRNRNGDNGSADVGQRNRGGQGRRPGGTEPPAGGELNPRGAGQAERGAGAEDDGRGGRGRGALQRNNEGQGDLQPTEEVSANLSKEEKDEYGKPLVLAKDGTTTFGIVDAETGLTEAPIRLSLGENTKGTDGKNHGYGLLHIEAGHGDQIRNAGYASVEEFVEEVAKNYTDIREGALIGNNQTYLLEVSDDHNNTLFIQLSKDGTYWNVNSAGIFKKKYSRRKPKVYSVPAVGEGTNTDTSEVNSGHTEGATAPAGNSSQASGDKDTQSLADKQIFGKESSAQCSDGELAAMSKDELGQLISDAEQEVGDRYDRAIEELEAEKAELEGKWRRSPVEGRRLKAIDGEIAELERRKNAEKLAASKRYREAYRKRLQQAGKGMSLQDLGAESTEHKGDAPGGYKIEPKPYTNKQGKTLDTYLVTFDRDFSKEELSALRAKAKALKGWHDRETGGWMLRNEADAKAFAAEVMGKSEDEIADEAPLSLADMAKGADSPVKKADLEGIMGDLHKKGEAKLSEHSKPIEQPAPKKRRWVSDEDAAEFEQLRSGLRKHLGADAADVAQEPGFEYGDKKSQSKIRLDLTTPPAEAEVTSSSSKGAAKLVKISENLKKIAKKFSGETSHKGAVTSLAFAIGANSQGYASFETANGNEVHIRISNHNANAEHFAERGHMEGNVSIVIKSRHTRNTFMAHPSVELAEYVYTKEAIKADGRLLSQVAESLRRMIETGEYEDLSGKAIVNRSPMADVAQEPGFEYGGSQVREMDPEVLRLGTRMTYLMLKGGFRKFSDYAEAMVEELGDGVRPHLKSLYAAAQNMEEVMRLGWDEEMDDRKAVKAFDVYNFDKEGAKDIIGTAQHVVDEAASQQKTEEIVEQLKEERNEKRKQSEGKKPLAPVGGESYVELAERAASLVESGERRAESGAAGLGAGSAEHKGSALVEREEQLKEAEERLRDAAHALDFEGEELSAEEVRGRIGELQSLWEGLSRTFGEEPADERAAEAMAGIERELKRWRLKDVSIDEDSAIAGAQERGADAPAAAALEKGGPQRQGIQDWGEEIWGARKNALREMVGKLDGIGVEDLVANPLSKVFKPMDWSKMAEKGEITPEDSLMLESLTRLIMLEGKPRIHTRNSYARRRSEGEIRQWAQRTAGYIGKLRELCAATEAEARRAVIESLDIRDKGAIMAERERMLEMNKGRRDGGLYAPAEIAVMADVLRGLGYPANGVGKAKFATIGTDHFGTSYEVRLGGGYYGRYATYREAVDACIKIAKASRGDTDIEYTPRDITARVTVKERRETGTWAVRGLQGSSVEEVKSGLSEAEAKALAEELQKKTRREHGAYAETESVKAYTPAVTDPVTREKAVIEGAPEFGTGEECRAWIEDNIEELQDKANAAISQKHSGKSAGKAKPHVQVYASREKDGTYMVWKPLSQRQRGGMSNLEVLAKGFKSYREAMQWAEANRESIDRMEAERHEARRKFSYFKPWVPRIGEDYRGGRDVSESEVGKTFGLRGVQFGNWTNQRDRQKAVNEAYDALMDLSRVLGISPRAIGLNGELGLAFGARGSGSANAHYEPSNVVINLTKTRGAGSLAHEWWHALDNYFSRRGGIKTGWMTEGVNAAVRAEVQSAFGELAKAIKGSAYDRRCAERGGGYWDSIIEESARLFAEWVDRKLAEGDGKNSFLSSGVDSGVAEDYRRMNYVLYKQRIKAQNSDIERRNESLPEGERIAAVEPMSYEEFRKTEAALAEFVYPTDHELETEFNAPLERLFKAMEEVEGAEGALALNEPSGEYGGYAPGSFESRLDKAVADKGTVTPGLAQMKVRVVEVGRHGFTGENPIMQARKWAKENLVGEHEMTDVRGRTVTYNISGRAVDKYLSKSAVGKSDNLGVHLSVLKQLPDVIAESIEAEVHPDYKKGEDKVRRVENGYNPDNLVHRLYGAVSIGGNVYRVKTTFIETSDKGVGLKPHSYEVTNIELLPDEGNSSKVEPTASSAKRAPVGVAKLLKSVEKSYDKGKKLLGSSGESGKFASRYETQDGKEIRYTSERDEGYGGLFDFDFSTENAGGEVYDSGAGAAGIRLEENPDRTEPGSGLNWDKGEFAHVERVFIETGSFKFTGAERIRDAADVAYIFSALEDAGKEHTFAVYVKDGVPTVVELGMGSFNMSIADIPTASLAYGRIRPDEVYFVHNHPTGNLICSEQDQQLLKKMQDACDVPVHGVIINLKTGKYGTFGAHGASAEGRKRMPGREVALTIHSLDKQIFSRDYDPAAQPLMNSPQAVAEFLNSHRMGDRAKVSFLVLSQSGRVVGNIHTPFSEISTDAREKARYISEKVVQFGGASAIVYGDFAISAERGRDYQRLQEAMGRIGAARLLDVVSAEGNYSRSAKSAGYLREPGAEYGGDVLYRLGDEKESFEERLSRAVKSRGTVMPGLNEAEVEVVEVPKHGYSGSDMLTQAIEAATERYAGKVLHYDNYGAEFDYVISKTGLKYAMNHSGKSENAGVHAAVMDRLDEVIGSSIEVMEHADVFKDAETGKRSEDNGYNEDVLMHRFVGAVRIDGETYRVITTLKEYRGVELNRQHTYEVTKIEVLDSGEPSTSNGTGAQNKSPLRIAKLVINSEIHNKSGKKILEESKKAGEVRFRIREGEPPRKTGIGYKVFVLKDGKLYPPMVANPGGESTPMGVWLDADAAPVAGTSKTGRQQVKAGGKGTQGGSGKLAYRPGWHLGEIPYALQFNRVNPETGAKELFPANFVWAEVEYANDVDYQEEAMSYGYNANGKFQHSYAGLPRLPKDGSYTYRTNPNPETDPWIITGAMKVNRLLTPTEVDELVRAAGREPQPRQAGAVSDAEIKRINGQSEAAKLAEASAEAKRGHAEKLAERLGTSIRIVEDSSEIRHGDARKQAMMRRSKGWYDPRTGEVVLVLGNHADVGDVAETVLHEVVGHKGLRELVGEERFGEFLDEVYEHLNDEVKAKVDSDTTRRFLGGLGEGHDYEHHRRVSMEEYFARLSEKGFEDFTKAERGIWAKLKAKVLEAINRFLGSLGLPKWVKLGDNELRYMLWRSHERLTGKGDLVSRARDAAKRAELGLDGGDLLRESKAERELRQANARFNEQLEEQIEGKQKSGHIYQLGRPGAILRSTGIPNLPIQMNAARLNFKATGAGHDYELSEVKGLVLALQSPVAVFAYGDKAKAQNIILEIQHNGKNFVVGLSLRPTVKGEVLEINSVRTVFPKDNHEWVKWITDGSLLYVDKEKIQPILTQQRMTLADVERIGLDLESVAKIVKEFENPKLSGEKGYDFGEGEAPVAEEPGLMYRGGETDDLWSDGSLGLEERVTQAALRLSGHQKDDLRVRNEAMRRVTENLQSLVHEMRNKRWQAKSFKGADRKVEAQVSDSMNAQAMYDRVTVKRVTDLARVLLQQGYLSDMTGGEVQRLLAAVRDTTAMHDTAGQVEKILDIMIANQLRGGKAAFERLLATRGSKVDSRGVEVQGSLDPKGQMLLGRLRDIMGRGLRVDENHDDFDALIAKAEDDLGSGSELLKANAEIELDALYIAREYVEAIDNSKAEERDLEESMKAAEIEHAEGRMSDEAFKQYAEASREQIRTIHISRVEAYYGLANRLGETIKGSADRAREFRESEKSRVERVHHYANSDLAGIPYRTEEMKTTLGTKLSNNGLVRLFMAPTATMEQLCRVIGYKSIDGNGYVKELVVDRWQECRDKEWTELQEAEGKMDAMAKKAAGVKRWSDLYAILQKKAGSLKWRDGDEEIEHDLTQGNLMYLYMADKMSDGRRLLRYMGITESEAEKALTALDARLKEIADWVQDEFLPELREKYNATYMRLFGAPMAKIESYVPLRVNKATTNDKTDLTKNNTYDGNGLPKTITGAMIKRVNHNHPIDLLGTDGVSLILEHVQEQTTWNAFAEYRKDLTTLLRYDRFRNRLRHMKTIYGSGKTFHDLFFDLAMLVGGAYKPKVGELDRTVVNLTKLATGACIALRVNTALKQLLSYPAFGGEASGARLLANMARPKHCLDFCLENLPAMERRWKERMAGNEILRDWDGDWDWTKSDMVKKIQRIGITPNAFVDLLTCCMGAEAAYQSRLKEYASAGYGKDAAHKKAVIDAEQVFNLSQQSSELPYLSLMQNNRSYTSMALVNFRNSPMSYLRQSIQSKRELVNMVKHKREQIEFETKKGVRSGLTQEQAAAYAHKKYNRNWSRNLIKSFDFDFLLPALWALGVSGIWYCIFGDDEEKKEEILVGSAKRGSLGVMEGMTGGGTIPDLMYNLASGEGFAFSEETSPAMGSVTGLFNAIGSGDKYGAINQAVNFAVSAGLGVNPQTLEDIVAAGYDHFGKDEKTMRDWEIFAMRAISVPQRQVDMVYFDEISMTAREAGRLTVDELAERYADYKLMHNDFATVWFYTDEEKAERGKRYRKDVTDFAKAELGRHLQNDSIGRLIEWSDSIGRRERELSELKKIEPEAYWHERSELRRNNDMRLHKQVKRYKHDMKVLTEQWLGSDLTTAEADSLVRAMKERRDRFVESVHEMPEAQ